MEAIILAGGFGTRLRQVVPDLPKPMASIAGRPFLEILLNSLSKKGFSRVILSLGFMAEKIIEYFGNSFQGINLVYVVEESPLGTGGAIRLALETSLQNHTFIFNGDTFVDLEIEEIEKHWQLNQSSLIVGRAVEDTSRYGRLMVENDKVVGFAEKGASGPGLINAGCYVLQKNELKDFPAQTNFSFENDYLTHQVQKKPFDLFVTKGSFIDIGIPEDYLRAQSMFKTID